MKLTTMLMAIAIIAGTTFSSCKPKDEDIKAKIEAAIQADPMLTGARVVDVKEGVATIDGEVKDDACKARCEKTVADIKGVKSVVNNCTVPAAVATPPSVSTTLDAATQQKVKDGLKDIKGVSVEFSQDKAIVTGQVTKADRMKIMQILASANVQSDVSGLKDKK